MITEETIITPAPLGVWRSCAELLGARGLFGFLVWRDVRVRYKQTVIGIAWVVFQPLLMMLVMVGLLGRLPQLRSAAGGGSYALWVLAGLVPWMFFAAAISSAASCLLANTSLVTKVYFPRLLIPLASVGVALVDMFVGLALLLAGLTLTGHPPTARSILAVPFLAGVVLAAIGIGSLVAALAASYRDVRHAVPFLIQVWMLASPVLYPMSLVPERWRLAYALNPVAGSLDAFRSLLLGLPVDWPLVVTSAISAVAVFLVGTRYFITVERRLADVI